MGTSWDEVNVQCPFFRGVSDRVIRCEGVIPGTTASTGFKSPKERKRQLLTVCGGRYWECPVYQAVAKKY